MLVLTRRVGDSIVIADEIVVTVLEVRSDQVRLGIDAPREVAVHREEVYRQMQGLDASEPVGRSGAARRRMRDGGKDRPGSGPDDPAQAPDAAPDAAPETGPGSGPEAGTGPAPEAAARVVPRFVPRVPEADGQRAGDGQRTSGSAPGYLNGRPRDAATAPSTETTA